MVSDEVHEDISSEKIGWLEPYIRERIEERASTDIKCRTLKTIKRFLL